jgi:hypothetical protein
MKDDGRRRGVPRPGLDEGRAESAGAAVAVLTIGIAVDEEPGTGRMMTSFPSKVRSFELSSVSGVTGSALTMMGYKAEKRWRT